jgi:hypothetical protein
MAWSVRHKCVPWVELPGYLSPADIIIKALLERLLREGWMSQDDMACWLEYERGVRVSQSTISRLLKQQRWRLSKKEVQRISLSQSREAARRYREEISRFPANDLVFLDESIFNEKTSWRHMTYAPIGHEVRYSRLFGMERPGASACSDDTRRMAGLHWYKGRLLQ